MCFSPIKLAKTKKYNNIACCHTFQLGMQTDKKKSLRDIWQYLSKLHMHLFFDTGVSLSRKIHLKQYANTYACDYSL